MTVTTDTWALSLPDDWVKKDSAGSDQLYFESADASKAMYIATWDLGNDGASGSAMDVAESFRRNDMKALHSMDGYSWRIVDELAAQPDGRAVVVVDHVAEAQSYRIVTKILADPPVVVRASFHDYLCEDYDVSRDYFAPIIESLSFRD